MYSHCTLHTGQGALHCPGSALQLTPETSLLHVGEGGAEYERGRGIRGGEGNTMGGGEKGKYFRLDKYRLDCCVELAQLPDKQHFSVQVYGEISV